jgi:hypothetical protein
MPPRILLAAALAATAPACTSDPGCSAVLYFSGMEIHAGPVDATTDYAITVAVDGGTLTVHSVSDVSETVQLADGRTLHALVSTYTQADGSVQLDILAQDDTETGPTSVAVTVADATTTLGQQTFTPEYATRTPDGPSCPSYAYAAANMTLTP